MAFADTPRGGERIREGINGGPELGVGHVAVISGVDEGGGGTVGSGGDEGGDV